MKTYNKQQISFYLLLLLGIVLVSTQCRKKQPEPDPIPEYKPQPSFEDLKKYAYFKTGTYWVYEDSMHVGTFDSVYVTNHAITYDTIKHPDGNIPVGIYPVFDYRTLDSKGHEREYHCESALAYFGAANGKLKVRVDWNYPGQAAPLIAGHYYGQYYLMSNRFIKGDKTIDNPITNWQFPNGDEATYLNHYDDLQGKNEVFHDVHVFNNFKAGSFGKYNVELYFAKNIGIVKRVDIVNNHNWRLLRYNIIQ